MDNYEWQEAYRPEGKRLFRIDRNTRNGQSDFNRQTIRGAEVFKLIIDESANQYEDEVILDSALSKAKERFRTFTSDGSKII